jgi:putative transposase
MSRCYGRCWTLSALWNEINYQRLMRYNDEDSFEGDVWGADTGTLQGKYKAVLGASTAQTVQRANTEAWRSFFGKKKAYYDESNTSVTEHPEPPGFRGLGNRRFPMVGES